MNEASNWADKGGRYRLKDEEEVIGSCGCCRGSRAPAVGLTGGARGELRTNREGKQSSASLSRRPFSTVL